VKVGDLFIDRQDLRDRHVHLPPQSGISGTKAEGADSVVVSGGYADDEDHGDYFLYTGHGGRENGSRKHVKNQSPEAPGNAGLITNWALGLPTRVTRGRNPLSPYAPPAGYQYAGLFLVTEYWEELGVDGFLVLRFRLDRIAEQAPLVMRESAVPDPAFATTTVSRRVRDSAIAREVKRIYENRCQVCGIRIAGIGNRDYSEGAHVKPLGRPHLGSDTIDNILCLCPNHHTQLDIGGMVLLDDFRAIATNGGDVIAQLRFESSHQVLVANARYHRTMWGPPSPSAAG